MKSSTASVRLAVLLAVLALACAMVFVSCEGDETEVNIYLGDADGGGDDDSGDDDSGDDDSGDDDDDSGDSDFEVIVDAADDYLSQELPPVMSAADLFAILNDGDENNDPFLLDIRSADAYADPGHIPGAVHVGFADVPDNLDLLPDDGTQIVVYCYTGHTCSQIAIYLNMIGYDAVALTYGMMGWNYTAMGDGKTPFDYTAAPHYGGETDANELTETYTLPDFDTGEETAEDIINARAIAYLDQGLAPVLSSADLFAILNDGDDSNDPFILDIRSADAYADPGHIPGAYFIGYRAIADVEMLQYLPTDKQIVVYCYTGHTCSQIMMLLQMLGYDSVALLYGMMGWDSDLMGDGKTPFDYTTAPQYGVEM